VARAARDGKKRLWQYVSLSRYARRH